MQPHKDHSHLNGHEKQALRQFKHNGKTERRLADRSRIILWTTDSVAVDEISVRLGLHRSTASQHSDLLAPTLRRRSVARPTGHRTLLGSAAFGAAATVHARPGGPDHGGRLGAAGPTGIAPPSLLAGRDCAVDQAGGHGHDDQRQQPLALVASGCHAALV